jgi:GNAT superfamily N-acetyltransferase
MAAVCARLATHDDVTPLARALTRAFDDDPIAIWSCPAARPRPRMLERFYVTRVRQLLATGEVWTTPDRAGAALWAPPDRWRTTPREDAAIARCMLTPRLVGRLPLILYGLLAVVERSHPPAPPHWYLAILGTDPVAQGRGIGSALLAPVLDRCDADGVGAYLESSKERNVDFYARHGFRVMQELRLPRGPRAWTMWREPR